MLVVRCLVRWIVRAPLEARAARTILGQNFEVGVFRFIEDVAQEQRRLQQLLPVRLVGEDVFQEPVYVASTHADQIYPNSVAEDDGEGEQNPRQVRRLKVEKAEEVHPQERIPSAPHVHEHDREGLPEEQQVDEEREDDHEEPAEHEHHDEVARLSSKTSFLQHPTISICEDHVEEKTKSDRSEEQEGCH